MTSQKALKILALVSFIAVILTLFVLVNGPVKVSMTLVKDQDSLKMFQAKTKERKIAELFKVKNPLTTSTLESSQTFIQVRKGKSKSIDRKFDEYAVKNKNVTEKESKLSFRSRKKENYFKGKDMNSISRKKGIPSIKKAEMSTTKQEEPPYTSEPDLNSLTEALIRKFQSAKIHLPKLNPTCDSNETISNSCQETSKCLRMELSRDIKTRISQLVNTPNLQLSKGMHKALNAMAEKVTGRYDVILLTAASSNHYFESQAMIKNVHEVVYPVLKNFTLLFYDLGLSATEHQAVEKYCKCQVLHFPFEKFPDFIRNLHCYSWKPIMIKAHAEQANVIMWADASVRFHRKPEHFLEILEHARQRGVQIAGSSSPSPFRTFRSMYHFFGDEPCVYLDKGQVRSGSAFYSNEPLVIRAILEPWVACAVHEECICKPHENELTYYGSCKESKQMATRWYNKTGNIVYGLCNRYDQSAISLILHKVYKEYRRWIMVNIGNYLEFKRGDEEYYFPKTNEVTSEPS